MSGTSYPSPASSSAPPSLSNSAPVATTSSEQGHVDTQFSLYQASAALEAAYNRIREVQRNLIELSDTLPPSVSQIRPPLALNIGPGHEAITLTEGQLESPGGLDNDHPEGPDLNLSSIMGRLRGFERLLGLEGRLSRDSDMSPTNLPTTRIAVQPRSIPSPLSPNRHLFPPRRTEFEDHIARRRGVLDDPNTTLGRRVAARVAAGATNTSEGFPTLAMSIMERDLEDHFSATRARRFEPQRLDTLLESNIASDITARRLERARLTDERLSSLLPPRSRIDPRQENRRTLGSTTYSLSPTTITDSERLSLLSNFSVRNLTTPSTTNSRPILFDEPSSYIAAANFSLTSPDTSEERRREVEERNYVVRRRMNADGEEHIHPISLEWSDEEMPWILSRDFPEEIPFDRPLRVSPTRYHPRRDTVQANQQPPPVRQRRRGWARLDADGNEISSEEEEELERIRAEHRLQAQSRPRPLVTAPTQEPRPRVHTLHSPMVNTRPTPGPEDDLLLDADAPPRIYLGPHDARAFYGGSPAGDYRRTRSPPRKAETSSTSLASRPWCANPLPTPLEEMLPSRKPKKAEPQLIRVMKHPIVAGR